MVAVVDFSASELGFSSCDGDDSNAILLPGKKKNKKNEKNKIREKLKPKRTPKLSKSQQRKLKKIEEEKEKKILLSQSIEDLEKYKIRDELYSLMWSSKYLGQVETAREKRKREIQFSKAGLEVPRSDKPSKKRSNGSSSNAENGIEVTEDYILELPTRVETDAMKDGDISPGSSGQQVFRDGHGVSGGDVRIPEKEVRDECRELSPQECAKSSVFSCSHHIQELSTGRNAEQLKPSSTDPDCSVRQDVITTTVVHVSRSVEVEEKRKELPIIMMEQEIMEAINDHNSVIICGETGCGKTTQVPQFLYEAGYGSNDFSSRGGIIGVTQPRRVAVLATAKRVAFELGFTLGKEVGFQVRHDRRVGDNCSIKFMTDGILLRELQNDILLRRYSVIILDEAHERSLNTDILIGMLSRVIKLRQSKYDEQQKMIISGGVIHPELKIYPLRLILMSATLRVDDFVSEERLFSKPPPLIEVPNRQYPVTIHFSKKTEEEDYIGHAYKKIMSIHKRLPRGGILVFVTGQREVEFLCRKLRRASRERSDSVTGENMEASSAHRRNATEENGMKAIDEAFEIQGNSGDRMTDRFSFLDEDHGDLSDDESDLSYDSGEDSEMEIYGDDGSVVDSQTLDSDHNSNNVLEGDVNLGSLKAAFEALSDEGRTSESNRKEVSSLKPGDSDNFNSISGKEIGGAKKKCIAGSLRVLPLYAMLPASAQLRVFDEVPEGERLVVVATNVAETSLTIPGIKYVVDTGREKVKRYNPSNSIETYEVQWISKASAAQRAGRAGRTGPGHCYRLYSSAAFSNILPDFSIAEICKVPVDGVVLLLRSMHIDKVTNFPFPTPPDATALVEAERCLKALGALGEEGGLTDLGKAMSHFPMSPRHSRMLLTVIQILKTMEDQDRQYLVLAYALAVAAALSLTNPFLMRFGSSHGDADKLKHDEQSGSVEDDNILDDKAKLMKKRLKETAKASRENFSNPTSDVLTTANALQCFEVSKKPFEFCSDHGLHFKTMDEMSKLRKQLLQLIFNSKFSNLPKDFSWNHGTAEDVEHAWRSKPRPLQPTEEEILGQAICAGWADRVAKRMKGASGLLEGEKRVNCVRYQACMLKDMVFLHRWSSLSKSAPEFLVYNELLQTKRLYMHGATRVKDSWLVKYARSLCTFSAPLADPKPYYDSITDEVRCWVKPSFGPHLWLLPLHSVRVEDDLTRVTVFAWSLLEGQVLPCLKSVQKYMALPPDTILRPESRGLKRVGNLLHKFRGKLIKIDSCAALRKIWGENPRVLYSEIMDWFQKGFHDQFEKLWIKMQHEIQLVPKERFSESRKRLKGKRKTMDKDAVQSSIASKRKVLRKGEKTERGNEVC